ncbi:hypothetical protein EDC01DRAFT_644332 [Geopyxis carbonaria]|nr:hypothetical protein EDC01DRAFT_644332 [Geopyxis carbonaria]
MNPGADLLSLPPEVQSIIFGNFFPKDLHSLNLLCQTCRTIQAIAHPILYQRVDLHTIGSNIVDANLIQSLLDCENMAHAHVRTLRLLQHEADLASDRPDVPGRVYAEDITNAIICSLIKRIDRLHQFCWLYEWEPTRSIVKALQVHHSPSLQVLSLRFSDMCKAPNLLDIIVKFIVGCAELRELQLDTPPSWADDLPLTLTDRPLARVKCSYLSLNHFHLSADFTKLTSLILHGCTRLSCLFTPWLKASKPRLNRLSVTLLNHTKSEADTNALKTFVDAFKGLDSLNLYIPQRHKTIGQSVLAHNHTLRYLRMCTASGELPSTFITASPRARVPATTYPQLRELALTLKYPMDKLVLNWLRVPLSVEWLYIEQTITTHQTGELTEPLKYVQGLVEDSYKEAGSKRTWVTPRLGFTVIERKWLSARAGKPGVEMFYFHITDYQNVLKERVPVITALTKEAADRLGMKTVSKLG